jgi:hypothetical protein
MARRGYVSLLAMAFALGRAIVGVSLVSGLNAYVRGAAQQERRLRTDIRLESAANAVLGLMVAGEPVPAEIDGVSVEVTDPKTKLDPPMDPPEEVAAALRAVGIGMVPGIELGEVDGLAAASAALKLSAGEDDCLRHIVTFGRAPADRSPAGLMPSTAAGDQVDLRMYVGFQGRDEVLWARARFTGDEGGWLLQDHRRLTGKFSCSRPSRS